MFFGNYSTCSTISSGGFNLSWKIQLIPIWRSIVISAKNNLRRIQQANFYFLMREIAKNQTLILYELYLRHLYRKQESIKWLC